MELGQFANLEAEDAVIGSLILQGDLSDEAFAVISQEDFYSSKNKLIFSTMFELKKSGKSIDAITISDELSKTGKLQEVGGTQKILNLMEKVISPNRIQEYSKIVKEHSRIRNLLKTLAEVQEKAVGGEYRSSQELVDFTESLIFKLALDRTEKPVHKMQELMLSAIKSLELRYKQGSQITGVPTGFPRIDNMTAGLQPGEVTILGARPSMGKTTLSLNIATNMSVTHKKHVVYFSLEMPKESLLLKLISMFSKVPFDHLKTGRVQDKEWSSVISAAGILSESPLYIDDSAGLSPYEIRSKCRRLKREGNLDCIMIDYLGLMKLKGSRFESREREIAEISSSLKEIAKELKVPVLALAQLNRDVEKRGGDQKPKIADLRDSGSIEQDADVIMLIHRPWYYDKTNDDIKNDAEIIVDKNRNGPTGHVKLQFRPEIGRFLESC